jgi:hypothetical protein
MALSDRSRESLLPSFLYAPSAARSFAGVSRFPTAAPASGSAPSFPIQALPRALVAGFVKADIDFQRKGNPTLSPCPEAPCITSSAFRQLSSHPNSGEVSGTTATLVVIDGFTVTVASVGDSRCILDTQGGELQLLTVDHRLEENTEEWERVTASGGDVGRLNLFGGQEVGPLRCWPGGLCLSRSIGDMDVGEFIVPIPHVKQVKVRTHQSFPQDAGDFYSALLCYDASRADP